MVGAPWNQSSPRAVPGSRARYHVETGVAGREGIEVEPPEEWSGGQNPAARRRVLLACLAVLLALIALMGAGIVSETMARYGTEQGPAPTGEAVSDSPG